MAKVELRVPEFPGCWDGCGNCAQGDMLVAVVDAFAKVGDTLEASQLLCTPDTE